MNRRSFHRIVTSRPTLFGLFGLGLLLALPFSAWSQFGGSRTRNFTSGATPLQLSVLAVASDAVPADEVLPKNSPVEEALQQLLVAKVECEFKETPLSEVIAFLRDRASASTKQEVIVLIDNEALNEEGIRVDSLITFSAKGMTLRSVLKNSLNLLGLSFVIEDEVLKVTTISRCKDKMVTRTYPVYDLCRTRDDYDALRQTIEETTSGPWIYNECGTIVPFPQAGSLVVRHTRDGHSEVLELLQSLRAAKRGAQGGRPSNK